MLTTDGKLSFKPVILFREHDDDDSVECPTFDHARGRAVAFFSSVEKAEAFRREFTPDDGQGEYRPRVLSLPAFRAWLAGSYGRWVGARFVMFDPGPRGRAGKVAPLLDLLVAAEGWCEPDGQESPP
jgi:hypothetical protein